MNRFLVVFLLSLVLTNCNSVRIHQQVQKKTNTNNVELGSIVTESHQLLFNPEVSVVGKPEYIIEIPLSIKQIKPIDKGYKKLKLLSNKFKAKDTINTTFKKLGYVPVTIQINDKVKMLENLSNTENNNTQEYIKNKSTSKLVTSITGVMSLATYKKLTIIDGLFLKKSSKNESNLLLYSPNKEKEIFSLRKNIELLTYNSEYFCWGANNRRKVVLKDIVPHKCSCEKGTSVKASKIKKDLEYVKF